MENNLCNLTGKNILITGASSGLGASCAIACSNMGARIIMVARDLKKLESVHQKLTGTDHLYYSQDLTQYDKIEGIISDAVNSVGKITGFIHSAGVEKVIPLSVTKPAQFEETLAINAFSGFELVRILSKKKYMGERSSYVLIASIMGVLGQKGLSAYCASKAALINGSKAIALEMADKGIRVNTISPAVVEGTEMLSNLQSTLSIEHFDKIKSMHPLGLGRTEDVANACIFLLSDASRWITGTNLILDGGYSIQ